MAAYKHTTQKSHKLQLATLALVLGTGFSLSTEAANIYRYVDASGRTVYNSIVPPEYVANGYTILDEEGEVVEVVPRALNAEEIAVREAELLARKEEEEAFRKQLEADNLLLRLYRSPEEVERKREERLNQFDTQMSMIQVNLGKASAEIEKITTTIDNARAAQREPAATVLESLTSKTEELERLNTQLARLQADKQTAIDDAERDIKRLRVLMKLPEPEVAAEPAAEAAAEEVVAEAAE